MSDSLNLKIADFYAKDVKIGVNEVAERESDKNFWCSSYQ